MIINDQGVIIHTYHLYRQIRFCKRRFYLWSLSKQGRSIEICGRATFTAAKARWERWFLLVFHLNVKVLFKVHIVVNFVLNSFQIRSAKTSLDFFFDKSTHLRRLFYQFILACTHITSQFQFRRCVSHDLLFLILNLKFAAIDLCLLDRLDLKSDLGYVLS